MMLVILVPVPSSLYATAAPELFVLSKAKKCRACRTLPRAYIIMLIFSLGSCSLLLWLQMINLFIVGGYWLKLKRLENYAKYLILCVPCLYLMGPFRKVSEPWRQDKDCYFKTTCSNIWDSQEPSSSVFCLLFPFWDTCPHMQVFFFFFISKMVAITYTLASFILNLFGQNITKR